MLFKLGYFNYLSDLDQQRSYLQINVSCNPTPKFHSSLKTNPIYKLGLFIQSYDPFLIPKLHFLPISFQLFQPLSTLEILFPLSHFCLISLSRNVNVKLTLYTLNLTYNLWFIINPFIVISFHLIHIIEYVYFLSPFNWLASHIR